MYLSPHFTLAELTHSETATRLGLDNTPSDVVIENLKKTALGLETIRTRLGVPVIVTSGYRSRAVNAAVKGQPASQHLLGQAADFIAPAFGGPATVVAALIDCTDVEYDQLILEFDRWVHVSFAANPRRQALHIDASGTRPLWK